MKPLVIVPKGGNICICVGIREGNKAITRTGYPTPTVEDLLVKLRGSAVFIKLDLVSAFHSEANSTAEELQNTLRNILADIPGALNNADNILIFAESETEHDEILNKVLRKCKETQITLNLTKCLFCKTLEFYIYFLKRGYENKS